MLKAASELVAELEDFIEHDKLGVGEGTLQFCKDGFEYRFPDRGVDVVLTLSDIGVIIALFKDGKEVSSELSTYQHAFDTLKDRIVEFI